MVLEDKKRGVWGGYSGCKEEKEERAGGKEKGSWLSYPFSVWALGPTFICNNFLHTVRHDSVENTNSTLIIKILNVAWVSRVQKTGRKKQGKEQDNRNHLFL